LPYHCGHKSEENPLLLAFALARICISNRRACIKYLPFRILCATKLWLPRLLLLAAEAPPVVPLVVTRRTRIFSVALLPVVLPLRAAAGAAAAVAVVVVACCAASYRATIAACA
jgi:hypothetical protein